METKKNLTSISAQELQDVITYLFSIGGGYYFGHKHGKPILFTKDMKKIAPCQHR